MTEPMQQQARAVVIMKHDVNKVSLEEISEIMEARESTTQVQRRVTRYRGAVNDDKA